METLRKSLAQLRGQLLGLGLRGRLASGAIAVLAVAGVIGLVVYSRAVDYATLYAGLEEEEAAKVVELLRAQQVPYQLSSDGRTVQVPWNRVPELRLELAAEGVVHGGSQGLELFERGSFGQSELAEQITYTRALQGELARTIGALEPVQQALVHIGRPKQSVFVRTDQQATASVVIKLKPGRSLSGRQIAGVRQLVAASVPNLDPTRVSLLDATGAAIAGPGISTPAEAEAGLGLGRERSVEEHLTRKAQSLLDTAFGPQRALVRVNATLDNDQFEERRETVEREGTPTTQTLTTRTVEGGRGAGGAVGVSGNTPGGPGASGAGSRESEEVETTEYAVGRSTRVLRRERGAIVRLTVGLLLDESLQENAAEIEKIVKEAVGFAPSRGDSFERSAVPFQGGLLGAAGDAAALPPEELSALIQQATLFGAVLIAGLVAALALRRGGSEGVGADAAAASVAGTSSARLQSPEERRQRVRAEAARQVEADPALAGAVLERWLATVNEQESA
ncbi:MAG: flagellar M-ring protein FliF [Planctomycetes bacterium]|nr:flagellar M-ring protein FliF [Planctomycetota bacterium]